MLQILFVEDDEKIRDCLVGYLKLKGHRVREAVNGEQAVALGSREAFDLILMDVKMPKLDGMSACQRIHQAMPSVRVVLMTGFHMTEELERLVKAGVTECLQKPLLTKDLDGLLTRLEQGKDDAGPPASGPASTPALEAQRKR